MVSLKCHTPSRWMPIGASRKVGHFFNAICHQDGCRLVHPAKWDIGKFRGAFVTNSDWCILSGGHLIYHSIHIYDGFRLMNPVLIIIHIHWVFKYHILIPYSLSYYLFKAILNLCTYFIYSFTYSFHILIHILVSYTHSCTHFIYSFMYSFYSYLVNYQHT